MLLMDFIFLSRTIIVMEIVKAQDLLLSEKIDSLNT